MKVKSREYKLLVNHEPFANPSAAVKAVWDEIDEGDTTTCRGGRGSGLGRVCAGRAGAGAGGIGPKHPVHSPAGHPVLPGGQRAPGAGLGRLTVEGAVERGAGVGANPGVVTPGRL